MPDVFPADKQADKQPEEGQANTDSSLDEMYEYMDADMAERNLRGIRAAVARWKAQQGQEGQE